MSRLGEAEVGEVIGDSGVGERESMRRCRGQEVREVREAREGREWGNMENILTFTKKNPKTI